MRHKEYYKIEIVKVLAHRKLATYRVGALVGINTNKAKELLEELHKEGKVKATRETLATYWELEK